MANRPQFCLPVQCVPKGKHDKAVFITSAYLVYNVYGTEKMFWSYANIEGICSKQELPAQYMCMSTMPMLHDDVIKWKHFPRYWPLCGKFTGSFDVFFDLRLNKPLSKQWWGWWFKTLWRPLWRHCNVYGNSQENAPEPLPLGYIWAAFYVQFQILKKAISSSLSCSIQYRVVLDRDISRTYSVLKSRRLVVSGATLLAQREMCEVHVACS